MEIIRKISNSELLDFSPVNCTGSSQKVMARKKTLRIYHIMYLPLFIQHTSLLLRTKWPPLSLSKPLHRLTYHQLMPHYSQDKPSQKKR